MVHLKGAGWLYRINEHLRYLQLEPHMAHQIIAVLYSTFGSINDPSSPTALDMLKVESTPATVRPNREIAKWLPGHNLVDHLSTSWRHGWCRNTNDLPSTKPECHQHRIPNVWIKLAVLQIPLGIKRWWIRIIGFIVEHCPVLKKWIQQLYRTANSHVLTIRLGLPYFLSGWNNPCKHHRQRPHEAQLNRNDCWFLLFSITFYPYQKVWQLST